MRVLLVLTVVCLSVFTTSVAQAEWNPKFKTGFVKGCTSGCVKGFQSGDAYYSQLCKQVCGCSATKMENRYSEADAIKATIAMKMGEKSPDKQMAVDYENNIKNYTQQCVNQLFKSSE